MNLDDLLKKIREDYAKTGNQSVHVLMKLSFLAGQERIFQEIITWLKEDTGRTLEKYHERIRVAEELEIKYERFEPPGE